MPNGIRVKVEARGRGGCSHYSCNLVRVFFFLNSKPFPRFGLGVSGSDSRSGAFDGIRREPMKGRKCGVVFSRLKKNEARAVVGRGEEEEPTVWPCSYLSYGYYRRERENEG